MKRPILKAIIALIVFIPLLALSVALIGTAEQMLSVSYELEHQQSKLDSLIPVMKELAEEQEESSIWLVQNMQNSVILMQSALELLCEDGTYNGPRMFKDGMVVEFKGDNKVIYPEEMPKGFLDLSNEQVQELRSAEDSAVVDDVEIHPEGKEPETVLLTAGKILDDLYYIEWYSAQEVAEYTSAHSRLMEVVDAAESAFGGELVILDMKNKEKDGTVEYVSFQKEEEETDPVLKEALKEAIITGSPLVTAGDITYYVSFSASEEDDLYLVFLLEKKDFLSSTLVKTITLCVVMLFLAILLIFYVTNVQRYIKKHPADEQQNENYRPGIIRRKVLLAGLIGLLIIVVMSCFLQILSRLQTETQTGQERLDALINSLEDEESFASVRALKAEENWYVHYGEKIAELLSKCPELSSQEALQKMCDAIMAKYLMLFDPEGKEIACNLEYSGFTLGSGQGENSEDFLRLQQGVSSIVHSPDTDPVTEIKAQMIGVSMPKVSSDQLHGVLMMALPPDLTSRTQEGYSGTDQLSYLVNISRDGNLYFVADSESGVIAQSNNNTLDQTPVKYYGLSEASLKDGFMGFATIEGQRYYVMTKAKESNIYYYATPMSYVYEGLLDYCLMIAGNYLILFAILSVILLFGFTRKGYEALLVKSLEATEAEMSAEEDISDEEKIQGSEKSDPQSSPQSGPQSGKQSGTQSEKKTHVAKWKERFWKRGDKERFPEEKTRMLFHILLFLMIIMIGAYVVLNLNTLRRDNSSLISFILFGDWMKGLNLFSLTEILMLAAALYVGTAIVKWILRMLAGVMGKRAMTVCKLFSSFVHYIAILVFIYFTLEYLGMQPGTILAGLGIVGVAVSFGAKDMIADIFAGISIVFEDAFQVGEFVKISGFRGRIDSIGIRMTKIIAVDNSVKIINNKDIKDVINLSKLSSWVTVPFNISTAQSIPRVREIMERELPLLKQKTDMILSGPKFLGVRETKGVIGTFMVSAECMGKDFARLTAFMNEEILEILKREKIDLFYGQSLREGEDQQLEGTDEVRE